MSFSFKKFTFSGNTLPKAKKLSAPKKVAPPQKLSTNEFSTVGGGKATPKASPAMKGNKLPSPKKVSAGNKMPKAKTAKIPKANTKKKVK